MDLNTYFSYALVTSILILMIITFSLAIKSWFDESTFAKNFLFARDFAQMDQQKALDDLNATMGFDEHVASTPGMQNLN